MPPILLSATIGDKFDSLFYNLDMWIYSLFAGLHSPVMNKIAMAFTSFGDEYFIIAATLIACVLCLFKKTRKYGIAIGAAVAIGTIITNFIAKPLVLRIRPYNTLQHNADYWSCYISAGAFSESDYSFPSGHTTGVFEIAVALGICLRSKGKKGVSWIPSIFAILTACSRIYLCVHYPTDVIGGVIAGTLAGVIGYLVALLGCKIMESTFLDKIDLGTKIKFCPKTAIIIVTVFLLAAFGFTFGKQFGEGGNSQRCAYENNEYECYNEALVDDDSYPAIDGKSYCKIHWKELSGQAE